MELHEIKVNETEFNLFMLNMKNQLLMEPDDIIKRNDIICMEEIRFKSGKKTGRKLNFKIVEIDQKAGKIQDIIIWNVLLRRLVNYDARLKMELKQVAEAKVKDN